MTLPDKSISQLIILHLVVSAYLLDLSELLLSWAVNVALNVGVAHNRSSLQPCHCLKELRLVAPHQPERILEILNLQFS